MKLYSVYDKEFAPYGRVVLGYDTQPLVDTLNQATPLPQGTEYLPSEPRLEQLPVAKQLQTNQYGGMPIQLGWCNGHNTKMNCLEYHRDSEVNLGTEDFILLLALQNEIVEGRLNSACVKAFRCPAGVLVEIYATTLHYAPCHVEAQKGFRVMVALPKGTNGPKPAMMPCNAEDEWLWACNKWLLAHPQSTEAVAGAYPGILGENIDLACIQTQ